MIILDACVLIAHFNTRDAHHTRAAQVLTTAAATQLAASPLTLAEILAGPARTGLLDRAQASLRRLDVRAIALPDDAPARLAALRAETSLKLPDCCVLLAAEQTTADIATFDDRMAAAARSRGITVLD